MTPIQIDFRVLTYIILGLFALVGFSRGWLREALTTIFLMALVVMIARPELAARIMTIISRVLQVIVKLVAARLTDPAKLQDVIDAIKNLFDIKNPYGFMILATVFLVLASYTVGKRALVESKLAPISRLLGGTLGAINGFVVLSLARQYLLTRLGITVPGEALSAPGAIRAAQAPQQVAVTFRNLYTPYQMSGPVLWLLLVLGFVVLVFFAREVGARRRAAKKK